MLEDPEAVREEGLSSKADTRGEFVALRRARPDVPLPTLVPLPNALMVVAECVLRQHEAHQP